MTDLISRNEKVKQHSLFIGGLSLVLGFLFEFFFYGHIPGITFPIYILLVVATFIFLSRSFQNKLDRGAILLILGLLFFSGMVAVRASAWLIFLNIAASGYILFLLAKTTFTDSLSRMLPRDYLTLLALPFWFIAPFSYTLNEVRNRLSKNQGLASKIIRGIIITVPLLFIFAWLFSSADLVVNKYLGQIFSLDGLFISRIIIVLIATCGLIGAYTYTFLNKALVAPGNQSNHAKLIGQVEATILLSSLNVLFLAFVIIQIAYLFGGEQTILAQGFTYAEYARRGFFELIAVALISLMLVWGSSFSFLQDKLQGKNYIQILGGGLVLQVFGVLASAAERLYLYEHAYGLTVSRFYALAIVIWLAIVFTMLLVAIIKKSHEQQIALQTFASVLVLLISLNVINPDALIAQININRFYKVGKIDVNYLGNLSDDAMPRIIDFFDLADGDNKQQLGSQLYFRQTSNLDPALYEWQAFNVGRNRAQKLLNTKSKELIQFKDYQPRPDLQ